MRLDLNAGFCCGLVALAIGVLTTALLPPSLAAQCGSVSASFSDAEVVVQENPSNPSMNFQVETDTTGECLVSITYRTVSGSATAGVDFESIAETTTMQQDNCTSEPVFPIEVEIFDDSIGEGTEDFQVEVVEVQHQDTACIFTPDTRGSGRRSIASATPTSRGPDPAAHVPSFSAVGKIIDDEVGDQCATSVSFSNTAVQVAEGDSGTTQANLQANVAVDIGDALGFCTVSVHYRTVDGSATAGSDYTAVDATTPEDSANSGVISFPIAIDVSGDQEVEQDETFQVEIVEVFSEFEPIIITGPDTFGGPQPASHLSLPIAASVTIGNDDLPEIFIDDMEVVEGDSGTTNAVFTVRAEPLAPESVFVNFQTADGTAMVDDGDYQATSGQVTIEPVAPYQATITVPVNGDTRLEEDETFSVELTSVDGGTITDREGIGTILNDEGEPSVSIDDVEVVEGDAGRTQAVFTVTVLPLTQDVQVDFDTENGTAKVGDDDYVAVTGSLMFPFGGATSQTISVPVVGDTRVEPDETFRVLLTAAEGVLVGDGEGIGTILNDDDQSVVRIAAAEPVSEGAGPAEVVVERIDPSGDPAQVRVAARSGTATAGEDFIQLTATVSWGPDEGGTRTVEIPILDDNLAEDDETIRVALSAPVEATLGSPSALDLVILDDEQEAEVEIVGDSDPDAVVEQQGELTVLVRKLDGTPIQGAEVFWDVEEGDAELTSGSPTVTGPDGVSRQVVAVGEFPGIIVIRATLFPLTEGPGNTSTAQAEQTSVVFRLRVRGDLDLESNLGDDLTVGGVLDFACIEPVGQFADFCRFLFGLTDEQEQEVVEEATPREIAAQGNLMLDLPQWSLRQVGRRLAALRGGGSRRVEEELAVVFGDQEVRLAALLQTVKGAANRQARFERVLDEELSAMSEPPEDNQTEGPRSDDPQPRIDEVGAPSRWGLFLAGRVATADRDPSEREEGFEAGIEGMTLGVDYRLKDNLILGSAIGYLTTDLDLDQDGGGLEADGYVLTAYGAWLGESVYADAVLGYGSNSFDVRRHVDLPVPFEGATRFVALGDTDGRQWMANLGSGWDQAFGASSLEIFGRGSYIDADLDGYRERGGGPFNLAIQEQSMDSLLVEAGVSYGYAASRDWGVLQPQVRAAVLHEFGDDSRLVRGSFVQDVLQLEFVVPTDEPDRNFANLGVGVTATTYHGRSFYIWYDSDLGRDDLEVGTFTLGARFEF